MKITTKILNCSLQKLIIPLRKKILATPLTRVNEILKKNKPNCKDLVLNPLCHCGYIYNIMYGNYFDGNEYKCIIIIYIYNIIYEYVIIISIGTKE